MTTKPQTDKHEPVDPENGTAGRAYHFGMDRRRFVEVLGAGLLVTVVPERTWAQNRRGSGGGGGRGGALTIGARVHVGDDNVITVMTGKVEGGQGARAELTQAAAEELRVPVERIRLVMGDTDNVPDDGVTAGSRTTPGTVPAVRQGAAAARVCLTEVAAKVWNVEAATLEARAGKVTHGPTGRTLSYGELARDPRAAEGFEQSIGEGVTVTAVREWKVLGASVARPNLRDLVTGQHGYPSDQRRPGMLYGKVLRPAAYGARLVSVDLGPAQGMPGVVAVRDGDFVGVAAPTNFRAEQALRALAQTAKWEPVTQPSSQELHGYLREHADGGVPLNPFAETVGAAHLALKRTYHVAYVQHAPLEPRAALAEWQDGKLTVWTGTQNPFGCRGELARAFGLSPDRVRVVVPDFGAGFGGKHTGETGVEAARLARAAGKPVMLRWTREEEFTWAYFRPAAVIDIEASLDAQGALTSWFFLNLNSGGAALDTPYRAGRARCRFIGSRSPLRTGSYRALAATANNFARESFMDELAGAAGVDPLDFRLGHLDNARLRAVLEEAAKRFNWRDRVKRKPPGTGVGLACGTEKGSYVAACVEVAIDRAKDRISVNRVTEVFECGAVLNPANLLSQMQGCIVMGLGPALREEVRFAQGKLRDAAFSCYRVPRFSDVPELDLHLLDRPDLPSAGGGETPIIALAPAVANAVFHATGERIRQMPVRLSKA
jgi:isoquinoline 1-oxidoreductase